MSLSNSLPRIRTHLDWFLPHAQVRGYGPEENALWISSVDHNTGRHPEGERPEGIEKRCYRWIESPFGSNLYWDLPLVAAVELLGRVDHTEALTRCATSYIEDYLARAVAENGLILWGNHYYYDAVSGEVVWFTGQRAPAPVDDLQRREAPRHEIRPLAIPWELLRQIAPEATEAEIRAMADTHVADAETGLFNRHADRKSEHPFLEAGALQAEAMCRLFLWTGDGTFLDRALRTAEFSFSKRAPHTGLLPVSPGKQRWDYHTTTSEVGLWADRMALCFELTRHRRFLDLADRALEPWLEQAWNGRAFFGKLDIQSGAAVTGPKETLYQPGDFADPWEPLFPAHDYPMQTAQGCLRLYRLTGRAPYLQGARRWASVVCDSLPAREGRGGYAESYGRVLHFLQDLQTTDPSPEWVELESAVWAEAEMRLWTGERYRTHAGEDRCDAVDGLGFFFLALLRREGVTSAEYDALF